MSDDEHNLMAKSLTEKAPDGKLETTWFPHDNGIVMMRNPNYIQSLFIGLTWFVINCPIIIWNALLKPLARALFSIGRLFVLSVWHGVCGNVMGLKLPKGVFAIAVNKNEE